jgi:hypothetical protein
MLESAECLRGEPPAPDTSGCGLSQEDWDPRLPVKDFLALLRGLGGRWVLS